MYLSGAGAEQYAKEKGLDVTCGVAIHNLLFTDDLLKDFNTNAKVLPPLRTKSDTKALLSGLKDGTIDMVTSDHTPMDVEHKKVEFDNALFGTIGLESAFGALSQVVILKTAIKLLTAGKTRFNIPENFIEEGAPANFTFFDPEAVYTFEEKNIHSTSKNSLFLGQELKGKVYGVLAGGDFFPSEAPEK